MSRGPVLIASAVAVVATGAFLFARSPGASSNQRAADVNVSCAPSQRALVRQTMAGAIPQVEILCVDAASTTPAGYVIGRGGELIPASFGPAALATPAMYYPQAVRAADPAPARTARVTRTSTAGTAPARRTARKASWQKRALVIGGSAGAGAGIGAIIGGKKGALIGAAIGGGSATVLDQVKNR
jgi:hypothetical protein